MSDTAPQYVYVSRCEWSLYSGLVFASPEAFKEFFDQRSFLDQYDPDTTYEQLLEVGDLDYTQVRVIGT